MHRRGLFGSVMAYDTIRSYVGKESPSTVRYARGVLSRSVTRLALQSALDNLQADVHAIQTLMSGERLSEFQKRRLVALGFGECVCLVPSPQLDLTQDPASGSKANF